LCKVTAEPVGPTHRDRRDVAAEFAKLGDSLRHLDQVGLARDSREVAQEDQQRRPDEKLGKADRGAVRPP